MKMIYVFMKDYIIPCVGLGWNVRSVSVPMWVCVCVHVCWHFLPFKGQCSIPLCKCACWSGSGGGQRSLLLCRPFILRGDVALWQTGGDGGACPLLGRSFWRQPTVHQRSALSITALTREEQTDFEQRCFCRSAAGLNSRPTFKRGPAR